MLQPATREAMDLLMEGVQAFARMEATGIRVDVRYLDQAIANVQAQIQALEKEFFKHKDYQVWVQHFGNRTKINSREQLGHVIFSLMGYQRDPHKTNPKTGRPSNEVDAFEHLDCPFVTCYFQIQRLKKALKTTLHGFRKETVDGRIHPFFDLHTAESYRSSSSRPNFHNTQVRDKAISEIVRTCIIPSPGCVLLEADYNIQEVRVSHAYHHDPRLKQYITSGIDMHKDRAREIYLLTDEELGSVAQSPGKEIRYCAKNMYTFPQFYGSTYVNCAPNLWEAISKMSLRTAQGLPLREHLTNKGITSLGKCSYDEEPKAGTFERHVAECDRIMWQEVFTVYDQWKRDWWALYQRQGGINTLTGFRMEGHFQRNQMLCSPIQGSAFHCELWTLIQVQRQLYLRKMKTRIINQIHDSILLDTPVKEVEDVIALLCEWGMDRIAKHWTWLSVPLKMEFEIAEDCWAGKKPYQVKETV